MIELLYMILPQGRFIYKTVIMFFLLAVTYLFIKEHGRRTGRVLLDILKEPWLVLFLLCTAYLLTCTVVGRYFTNPYKSILGSVGILKSDGGINVDMVANVLMFVPYVFLFLKAFKPNHPFRSSLFLSFCTTIFIELSQLIGWLGNFQLIDLVHNMLGGVIGFGLWYLWEKIR